MCSQAISPIFAVLLLLSCFKCGKFSVINTLEHKSIFLLLGTTNPLKGAACKTPNRIDGVCVDIFTCPGVMAFMLSNNTIESRAQKIEIIQKNACGEKSICCQPNGEYMGTQLDVRIRPNENNVTDEEIDLVALREKFEEDIDDCGYFRTARINGGQSTNLDEFPWTVQLFYKDLISKRNANFENTI